MENNLVGMNAKLIIIAKYFGFVYCVNTEVIIGDKCISETPRKKSETKYNRASCSVGISGMKSIIPIEITPNKKPIVNLKN